MVKKNNMFNRRKREFDKWLKKKQKRIEYLKQCYQRGLKEKERILKEREEK